MFQPPTRDECIAAIGLQKTDSSDLFEPIYEELYPKSSLPWTSSFVRALQPDDTMFQPIPKPEKYDWLANHKEAGQTFFDFASKDKNPPDSKRSIIYFQHLSFTPKDEIPAEVLDLLLDFAAKFFNMKVTLVKPVDGMIEKVNRRTPTATSKLQVHAGHLLKEASEVVPEDAFCLAMVTMTDLYPRDEWNFVFGLASAKARVGVYSLARYMPNFNNATDDDSFSNLMDYERPKLLKRTCLLMCHEIGHMFGLAHCIYYHCLMNGSNHFAENDCKPLYLCPVCLRKLHFVCHFDVTSRYEALESFCRNNRMITEADWFTERLKQISK